MRLTLKPLPLNLLAVLHDAVMAGISLFLALYLRLSGRVFSYTHDYLLQSIVIFVVLQLTVLLYFRAYRHLWRYTALTDLIAIAKAGSIAIVLFYLALFVGMRLENVPRSIPAIHWMTLMLCLTGGRVLVRLIHDRALIARLMGTAGPRIDVLLIGATPQAEMFIREARRNADFPYRIVGLIDADERQHGREIMHVRIMGGLPDISYVLRKLERKDLRPKRLVVATPAIDRLQYEALLTLASEHNITLARLPSLTELKAGDRVHDIRPVAVEDILGRDEAVLDRAAMRALVHQKRVLVTGAGGSIGSELVRQILRHEPAEMLLFEQSEYALYSIDQQAQEVAATIPRHSVIGDVRDVEQLARAFTGFRPEIVFHAAAIKHVPLSEANPDQAVLTNILGSKHVADACVAHQVGVMVQISTDKAVNPTSVMGATKRAAEIYCQMLAQEGAPTRFVTVRFGNVLNSTGSVVPLFQKQIARGGPVTVTHKDMTRYFMSIAEAVQLVLQAAVLGTEGMPDVDYPSPHRGEVRRGPGEGIGLDSLTAPPQPSPYRGGSGSTTPSCAIDRAPIFVLDMGEPVKITELAEQMIRLAGLTPHEDIEIAFTGLRPGEKLFEELFHDAEDLLPTRHALIRLARARALDRQAVLAALGDVIAAARNGNRLQIPTLLTQSVAEYTPDQGLAA